MVLPQTRAPPQGYGVVALILLTAMTTGTAIPGIGPGAIGRTDPGIEKITGGVAQVATGAHIAPGAVHIVLVAGGEDGPLGGCTVGENPVTVLAPVTVPLIGLQLRSSASGNEGVAQR